MRLLPAFISFFLLSFVASLPISLLQDNEDVSLSELYQLVYHNNVNKRQLEKRENVLLTQAFTALNKSGQGVALVKAFTTNLLTEPQAVKVISNYLVEQNLTVLLEAADESGLALDIVLLALTNYDVVPGLIKIARGALSNSSSSSSGSSSGSSSSSGGLLGGLLGGIFGNDDSSSSSSNSTSSSSGGLLGGLLGNIFGTSSTSSGSSSRSANSTSTTSASTSTGGLLSGLIGDIFGDDDDSSSASTSTRSTSTSTATGGLLNNLLGGLAGTTATTATTGGVASTTLTSTRSTRTSGSGLSGIFGNLLAGDDSSSSATVTPTTTATASANNLDTLLAVSSPTTAAVGTATTTSAVSTSTSTNEIDTLLNDLFKRDIEDIEDIEKRDIFDTVIQQLARIIATDNNVKDIAVSLEKSGLGISVVKLILTDDAEYDFAVDLVKTIIDKKIITLSDLLTALKQSHLIGHIVGDIIGNFSYIKLVIQFVLAVLTGKVDLFQ